MTGFEAWDFRVIRLRTTVTANDGMQNIRNGGAGCALVVWPGMQFPEQSWFNKDALLYGSLFETAVPQPFAAVRRSQQAPRNSPLLHLGEHSPPPTPLLPSPPPSLWRHRLPGSRPWPGRGPRPGATGFAFSCSMSVLSFSYGWFYYHVSDFPSHRGAASPRCARFLPTLNRHVPFDQHHVPFTSITPPLARITSPLTRITSPNTTPGR